MTEIPAQFVDVESAFYTAAAAAAVSAIYYDSSMQILDHNVLGQEKRFDRIAQAYSVAKVEGPSQIGGPVEQVDHEAY